jgi:hypothetical protein
MGSNWILHPSEGETVTRAASRGASLRRWEGRPVAHAQGAPCFRTRAAGCDPGGPSLATCRSAQSGHVDPFAGRPDMTAICAFRPAGTDVKHPFLIASGDIAPPATSATLVRMVSTERSLPALHFALGSHKLRGARSRTSPEISRPASYPNRPPRVYGGSIRGRRTAQEGTDPV